RAGGVSLAERNATVDATRGLGANSGFGSGTIELAPVPHAFLDRLPVGRRPPQRDESFRIMHGAPPSHRGSRDRDETKCPSPPLLLPVAPALYGTHAAPPHRNCAARGPSDRARVWRARCP